LPAGQDDSAATLNSLRIPHEYAEVMAMTIRNLFTGIILLLSAAAFGAGPSDGAVSRDHRATLDSFRTAHVRAYLGANPDGMLQHLADDVRLMPAYQKTILGKTDATTYYRAFANRFVVGAYDRQAIEMADLGQRVLEIGRFTITLTVKGQPESHTLAGKYMDIWKKSPDGRLLLETAGWNQDQLPRIAEQLRFADVPAVHMALQARLPVAAGTNLELAALNKLQESVISQHDGKTWALFYADDVILLANHGSVVTGRKAIDEYSVAHAKALPVFEKLDLRIDRIDDLGKYVVEYATGVVAWKVDDYSGVNLGKNIRIWRRSENGGLRIWRAISMYD
jgi:ketosteroid isomerase-like protein